MSACCKLIMTLRNPTAAVSRTMESKLEYGNLVFLTGGYYAVYNGNISLPQRFFGPNNVKKLQRKSISNNQMSLTWRLVKTTLSRKIQFSLADYVVLFVKLP